MEYILTLVLMVSTTTQNRAMSEIFVEYKSKETCEIALTSHMRRIDSLTVGERYPERMVGVILASCTKK